MPSPLFIASTRITEQSHERFGRFSGDLNPIHADRAAASLMEPGGLLAYGMDLVLWSLESLAQSRQVPTSFSRIRARFMKWVYLESEVTLQAGAGSKDGQQSFQLFVDDAPVATLELFTGERQPAPTPQTQAPAPARLTTPRELTLEQLQGREGQAAVPATSEATAFYPGLTAIFGASAVAELAACSYIIGMEAPGLYSMSMRYDLHLAAASTSDASYGLHYRVDSVDPRFRKAKVAIAGTHITGTLEAFVRT